MTIEPSDSIQHDPPSDPCACCGQADPLGLGDYMGQMLCNWCHMRAVADDLRQDLDY